MMRDAVRLTVVLQPTLKSWCEIEHLGLAYPFQIIAGAHGDCSLHGITGGIKGEIIRVDETALVCIQA
jgi:hypothetical protein